MVEHSSWRPCFINCLFLSCDFFFSKDYLLLAYTLNLRFFYLKYMTKQLKITFCQLYVLLSLLFFFGGGTRISLLFLTVSEVHDHPQFRWLLRTTQHIFELIALIYYNKRIQSKISKGERKVHGRSLEDNEAQVSESSLLVESHNVCLIRQPVVTVCVKCVSEKLISHSVPTLLLEAGHIDTLCLTCTKILDFQNRSRWSA